ncbi:MAG TPA: TatD family hydrolase [Candidatus Peribacteraceae bacterium]|nr:TatD family hydrolase [Candidatus Peribacteraceae bacterium]
MIDSHCHLADKQFAADLDAVVARAEEHGVDAMIAIADDLAEAKQCFKIAEQYQQVFWTAGVHPHHAKYWKEGDDRTIEAMLASSPKGVAVGEIGLDYHYHSIPLMAGMNSPRETQQRVFQLQLALAARLDLPAVIHNRDSQHQSSGSGAGRAWADLWQIVQAVKPRRAVLHCCTEKWSDVAPWIEAGYLLSFTGIATYPQAADIRETIRQCPLEKMMIETDAPYLPPEAQRAKGGRRVRNEPAFVTEVCKLIAEIKGISLPEVDTITTQTTVEFFNLLTVP